MSHLEWMTADENLTVTQLSKVATSIKITEAALYEARVRLEEVKGVRSWLAGIMLTKGERDRVMGSGMGTG